MRRGHHPEGAGAANNLQCSFEQQPPPKFYGEKFYFYGEKLQLFGEKLTGSRLEKYFSNRENDRFPVGKKFLSVRNDHALAEGLFVEGAPDAKVLLTQRRGVAEVCRGKTRTA